MAMKIGNVELYMGPSRLGAPDDLRQVIIDFIDGAEKRLEIAVQELDDPAIADAILEAKGLQLIGGWVVPALHLR